MNIEHIDDPSWRDGRMKEENTKSTCLLYVYKIVNTRMYGHRMCTHIYIYIYTYEYIVYYIELKMSGFIIAFWRLSTQAVVTIGHG